MKEIVDYIARQLVDEPDRVEVKQIEGDRTTVIELRVAPEDIGKVIGREGPNSQGHAGHPERRRHPGRQKRAVLEILE